MKKTELEIKVDSFRKIPNPYKEVYNIVQEAVTKTIPRKKKCKKAK